MPEPEEKTEETQQTEETQETRTPEYVTKAEYDALKKEIETLKKTTEGEESEGESEEAYIDRLWNELNSGETEQKEETGSPEKENEDDPVLKTLNKLSERIERMEKLQTQSVSTEKRKQIDAEMAQKYPDWGDVRKKAWEIAMHNPNLPDKQVYLLAKAETKGVESLTAKERDDAGKMAEQSKRSASEKPTGGAAQRQRADPGNFIQAAKDSLEEFRARYS